MKKCTVCNQEKDLIDFYSHKGMKDHHLNKCIDCCKKQQVAREKKLRDDPNWVLSEQKRSREKYHRLGYKTDNKSIIHKLSTRLWKTRFPEKRLAQNNAKSIICPDGFHRHHWSYNENDQKDVIILSYKEHGFYHRYTIYDPERMMYRDLNGKLLDTKEKYIKYINSIPKEE